MFFHSIFFPQSDVFLHKIWIPDSYERKIVKNATDSNASAESASFILLVINVQKGPGKE